MKKLLSVLLVIVLLIWTVPSGVLDVSASAACSNHIYTNACDIICNECGAKRSYTTHNYEDCFNGREDNIDYSGEWKITPTKTAVYGIKPIAVSENFTYHYLVVTDKNGSEVKFNDKLNGWPMVKGQKYTIRLKCQYDDTPVSDIAFRTVQITDNMFPDTATNAWYSDALTYVVGNGLMTGYGSNGKFGTADSIQRQDFLVMLARFDGVDLTEYENRKSKFPDVQKGSYYEAAVIWGFENGIVTGYDNGKFGTGDKITREQLVTFLYRYADKVKDMDVICTTAQKNKVKNTYTDYTKVAGYAQDAVIWAATKGVINGKTETTLAPYGNAQRCETAQIMYNIYSENILPTVKLCIHTYNGANCTTPKTCTLCGATKGAPSGHLYSDATCAAPMTCKKCGTTRGESLDHNYVLGECVNCNDYSASYCPKLYFTGDMSNMNNKKDVRDITFEYRSRDQILTGAAKIKPQGTSSMAYDKKNFTINFYKDGNYAEKLGVDVGWDTQDEYCLKANWIDKTHSRNVVSAKLVGEMQAKYGLLEVAPNNGAIDGFPVEVYINGEFHGLYTMNIPKADWQFGMDENNPNHIVICGENWNDPVQFKAVPTDLNDWAVEVGPEDDATLEKVQRLVDFVLNSSDAEFKANFSQYLNLDATLNYYVMMTYGWMPDNRGKNMLLATYDGKVWYPSLYDLDTTWGTHWQGNSLYNYQNSLLNGGDSVLWKRMEQLFSREIAERYFELREDVLDTTHVMQAFSDFYSSIPQEVIDREFAKWNTEETPIPGYDISQIQDYLNSVIPRLDAKYAAWL